MSAGGRARSPLEIRAQEALLFLARIVVGGIFVIASVDKIQSPGAFADAVRAFHILPGALVYPYAFAVPWLELLVGLYLVFGFLARLGALGSIVLLAGFVFAIGSALASGDINHACGCFGSGADANPILAWLAGGNTITPWDLVRDLLLIALSTLILIRGAGPLSIDAYIARRREEGAENSRARTRAHVG